MITRISAEELKPLVGKDGVVLVDTRIEEEFRVGTIPGAIHVNVYDYFIAKSDEAGIIDMAEAAAAAFSAAGLKKAEKVIFFEEETGMRSPRGLWFLELLGAGNGFILDGGIAAWRAVGGVVDEGKGDAFVIGAVKPGLGDKGTVFERSFVASIEDVLSANPDVDILDVRRPSEYDGSFLHDCCARPGCIPNAKHVFYEEFLEDGHYRTKVEIAAIAERAGVSPERPAILYCHRGARAATALYALRIAGFDKLSIFVGSWHEWAGTPELPVTLEGAE